MKQTPGTWMLGLMAVGWLFGCVPTGSDKAQVFTLTEAPNSEEASPSSFAPPDAGLQSQASTDASSPQTTLDAGTVAYSDASAPDATPAPQVDAGVPDGGFVENCPPGLSSHHGVCAPEAPEPFRSRTEVDICTRWQQDHCRVSGEWSATPGSTDDCALYRERRSVRERHS